MSTVDVIITTYRRPLDIVRRAIDSVKMQSFENFLCYIIDDSGDFDNKQLEDYISNMHDPRFIYKKNKFNVGACKSRNIGVSLSESPYVAFLDDDDEWDSEKLRLQIKAIDSNNVDFVFCGISIVIDDKNRINYKPFSNLFPTKTDLLMHGNIIGSTSCALVSRRAFELVYGFDEEMPALQDYDLWIRLLNHYSAFGVNLPLLKYHVHSEERISTNPYKKFNGYLKLYNKNLNTILSSKVSQNYFFRQLGYYAALCNDYCKSFRYILQAIKVYPYNFSQNFKCLIKSIFRYNSKI